MTVRYKYDRHNQIAAILEYMDAEFLLQNNVMFAGGTLLALTNDEYRRSDDIDFIALAGSPELKNLRQRLETSIEPLFVDGFDRLRFGALRRSQYGFISAVGIDDGEMIKLEIFFEGRVKDLQPAVKCDNIPVPALSPDDLTVQKLLANGDRYYDPAVYHRDLYDLAIIANGGHDIPKAIERAEELYTVKKELVSALARTEDPAARKLDFERLEIAESAEPAITQGLNLLRSHMGLQPLPSESMQKRDEPEEPSLF